MPPSPSSKNPSAKQLQENLDQANERIKSLERFAHDLVHELRSLLMVASGNVELGLQATDPGEKDIRLRDILTATDKMERLMESLSRFSRHEKLERIDFLVFNLIEEVVDTLGHQIKEKKAIMHYKIDPIMMNGDRDLLLIVLKNIIQNAIKYNQPQVQPRITIEVKMQNESTVIIQVIDNGRGIPQDQQEAIFEPYVRLSNSDVKGSGLGLSLAKRIVEAHRGKITVESTVGKESTFTLILPVVGDRGVEPLTS